MSSPISFAAVVVGLGAAPVAQAGGAVAMEGDEEPYINSPAPNDFLFFLYRTYRTFYVNMQLG